MRAGIASGLRHAAVFGAFALLCLGGAARAEDAESWKEIETKYIFGFTTGSGIGIEGEKEFTVDSIGRFGKRDGHYAATETKYEYEFTPSQFIQIEFGALGSTHNIGGVTDLDNRNAAAFAGGFAEFRYLALERTLGQLGTAVWVENLRSDARGFENPGESPDTERRGEERVFPTMRIIWTDQQNTG